MSRDCYVHGVAIARTCNILGIKKLFRLQVFCGLQCPCGHNVALNVILRDVFYCGCNVQGIVMLWECTALEITMIRGLHMFWGLQMLCGFHMIGDCICPGIA